MTEPGPQAPLPHETGEDDFELPPGNHALEVAARRGLGPLSPLGRKVWHGDAKPCVSCGQLVHRDDQVCEVCGQDLSDEMVEKMLAHAGPWYVAEHVRPFPGVTIERIIRQIRRGVITETSIVRGPETGHQWRFAGETPGLCRYFGRCWQCHEHVEAMDSHCPSCLSDMRFQVETFSVTAASRPLVPGRPATAAPPAAPSAPSSTRSVQRAAPPTREAAVATVSTTPPPPCSASTMPAPVSAFDAQPMPSPKELRALAEAVRSAPRSATRVVDEPVQRIAGVSPFWVLSALLILVIAGLLVVSKMREDSRRQKSQTPTVWSQPCAAETAVG